jgi:hypothetical protein
MKMMLIVAAVLVLPIAGTVTPPDLKEGLWSVHSQSIDNPGNKKTEGTYMLCRSHAFDQSTLARAKSVKGCTTVSETLQAGKYVAEMHCVTAGSVIDSKGTTTFQSDTSTHSESHATYAPALYGVSETTMIMDQKYVGSCPAGAQPGDRIDANGHITHLGRR